MVSARGADKCSSYKGLSGFICGGVVDEEVKRVDNWFRTVF